MQIRSGVRASPETATRVLTGVVALGLGGFLLWGVGFADATALHDTAHDVRHAMGFPCH